MDYKKSELEILSSYFFFFKLSRVEKYCNSKDKTKRICSSHDSMENTDENIPNRTKKISPTGWKGENTRESIGKKLYTFLTKGPEKKQNTALKSKRR